MSNYHVSVLLQEAIDALQIQKGKKYIDATLGGGGHSLEIVARGGIALGIDQDIEALDEVRRKKEEEGVGEVLQIVGGNFNNVGQIARENGFGKVAGILFDIGISSHHVDTPKRGFSLAENGPLDMRMDVAKPVTAADLVNGLNKGELIELFTKYGEEPFAKRIAEAIVQARQIKKITTTKELAELIAKSAPKIGKTHPATRVFQALRIAVNDELHALEEGLTQAIDLLDSKGRLVVITFHSLEDRIVKKKFEALEEKNMGSIVTKKPIVPTDKEIAENKRSRSAKMRVWENL